MTSASELRSGKGDRDENFPVASWIIHPRHRALILAYYNFVRTADDIADHATLPADEKLRYLDLLEAELLGKAFESLRVADGSGAASERMIPLPLAPGHVVRRDGVQLRKPDGAIAATETVLGASRAHLLRQIGQQVRCIADAQFFYIGRAIRIHWIWADLLRCRNVRAGDDDSFHFGSCRRCPLSRNVRSDQQANADGSDENSLPCRPSGYATFHFYNVVESFSVEQASSLYTKREH